MFYLENEIDELKKCSICSDELDDPRILPCSVTACNSCIHIDNDIYECKFCSNTHLVPLSEGFPRNGLAILLLKKQANEIHRSDACQNLKRTLNTLKKKSECLNRRVLNAEETIRKECDRIRSEIQLKTEEAINKIHEYSRGLLGEVDSYENNCIEKLESCKNRVNIMNLMNYYEKYSAEWSNYLKQPKIRDSDVEKALKNAKNYLKQIQIEVSSLKSWLFSNKIASFNKSSKLFNCKSLLGEIEYENTSYLNIKFDFMNRIDLTNVIEPGYSEINAFNLNDNEFVLFCLKTVSLMNSVLNLFVLDKTGKTIKYLPHFEEIESSKHKAHVFNEKIYLWMSRSNKIYMLNKKLEIIDVFSLRGGIVLDIAFNDLNVNILTEDSIDVFDYNFNHKRSLTGLKNDPKTIVQFECNTKYAFYLEKDFLLKKSVTIKDFETNKLIKKFSISANSFSLIMDKLVLLDQSSRTLEIYESAGKIKHEIEIDFNNRQNGSQLVILPKGNSRDFFLIANDHKELFLF
jgi:hypothetical protein